ncbi:MAG TPA: glycosyltransferase family 39 protein, partial [Bryobacteraceae bacterium]|nr:glycosyltransferase family 39 protein [Bryobacteraceae bacterium]
MKSGWGAYLTLIGSPDPIRMKANVFTLACCLLFLVSGGICISALGIQTDEALFAAGIYPPFDRQMAAHASGYDFPLMVMTYVGTLKSWLYRPVFALFGVSPFTIRFPALLIGAATIWMFYRLLLHALGQPAALLGVLLLATDSTFLLTTRWDWGPVALQHFCLVAALLALLKFHLTAKLPWLAAGFLFLGLGLWDKATFIWLLAGISAASVAAFPWVVVRHLKLHTVVIALCAAILGAAPLLIYNVHRHWLTLGNAAWSAEGFTGKAGLLQEGLAG